jgi:hypothetical protein
VEASDVLDRRQAAPLTHKISGIKNPTELELMPSRSVSSEIELWDAQLVGGDERRLSPHHRCLSRLGHVGHVGESTTSQRRESHDTDINTTYQDGRSVPIDVGRSKRLATVHQRRALEAIYLHCAILDCEVIFDHCNVHHIKYWENGGPTDLDNMVPLCSQHHHAAHEGGWKLTLNPKTRKLTIS